MEALITMHGSFDKPITCMEALISQSHTLYGSFDKPIMRDTLYGSFDKPITRDTLYGSFDKPIMRDTLSMEALISQSL